ncbi:c-type cytochrome [Variovorax sp. VNK109]|jgi:cytochrome c556|uniref:c-type cytochrome n=1 Tax=Variovorax sp. VNK109 TaxID=3400919 RepID=UPI003C04E6A1
MNAIASLALAAAAVSLSAPVFAQFANPQDAIKHRQSTLKEMQQNFARVAGMANGRFPFDAAEAAEKSQKAADLIKLPWTGFGPGTEGGKAKPEIWKEQAKFKELADASIAEMGKLAAVAKTGNLDSIKASVGTTGASCKACHDAFRN